MCFDGAIAVSSVGELILVRIAESIDIGSGGKSGISIVRFFICPELLPKSGHLAYCSFFSFLHMGSLGCKCLPTVFTLLI